VIGALPPETTAHRRPGSLRPNPYGWPVIPRHGVESVDDLLHLRLCAWPGVGNYRLGALIHAPVSSNNAAGSSINGPGDPKNAPVYGNNGSV
jgi:hypothetical protein